MKDTVEKFQNSVHATWALSRMFYDLASGDDNWESDDGLEALFNLSESTHKRLRASGLALVGALGAPEKEYRELLAVAVRRVHATRAYLSMLAEDILTRDLQFRIDGDGSPDCEIYGAAKAALAGRYSGGDAKSRGLIQLMDDVCDEMEDALKNLEAAVATSRAEEADHSTELRQSSRRAKTPGPGESDRAVLTADHRAAPPSTKL